MLGQGTASWIWLVDCPHSDFIQIFIPPILDLEYPGAPRGVLGLFLPLFIVVWPHPSHPTPPSSQGRERTLGTASKTLRLISPPGEAGFEQKKSVGTWQRLLLGGRLAGVPWWLVRVVSE